MGLFVIYATLSKRRAAKSAAGRASVEAREVSGSGRDVELRSGAAFVQVEAATPLSTSAIRPVFVQPAPAPVAVPAVAVSASAPLPRPASASSQPSSAVVAGANFQMALPTSVVAGH